MSMKCSIKAINAAVVEQRKETFLSTQICLKSLLSFGLLFVKKIYVSAKGIFNAEQLCQTTVGKWVKMKHLTRTSGSFSSAVAMTCSSEYLFVELVGQVWLVMLQSSQ